MRSDLSAGAFRAWIRERLDPLESDAPSRHGERSDFDLDKPSLEDSRSVRQHDSRALKPAAVLIGLVERPEGLSVILTRRADTLRNHTGQVALPGGRCDPGEAPWSAALREAEEEIGLDPSRVTLAGLSTAYRTGTGYHVTPVVGFISPPIHLAANPAEVADIFEPPFAFLMDPANLERRESVTPTGENRRFYAMTWRNQLIWGATAGMLCAFRDRLFQSDHD